MGECGLRALDTKLQLQDEHHVSGCRLLLPFLFKMCARLKGDGIKVRGEEVRTYIIVVIFVDREMFRDLTGFLLPSLG